MNGVDIVGLIVIVKFDDKMLISNNGEQYSPVNCSNVEFIDCSTMKLIKLYFVQFYLL